MFFNVSLLETFVSCDMLLLSQFTKSIVEVFVPYVAKEVLDAIKLLLRESVNSKCCHQLQPMAPLLW